jgi:hypothetical protein
VDWRRLDRYGIIDPNSFAFKYNFFKSASIITSEEKQRSHFFPERKSSKMCNSSSLTGYPDGVETVYGVIDCFIGHPPSSPLPILGGVLLGNVEADG